MKGEVVSVYKKYTVGSVGIWEKIRRLLVVDPNRSSGVPFNSSYRNPSPASVPPLSYDDPVTLPAGDIAENPYWKRDTRRNYSITSVMRQNDVAGLLTLGSAAAPRIADGSAGEKQLVEVKSQQGGVLATLLESKNKEVASEILGEGGLPPLPGNPVTWVKDTENGFPPEYPCRTFT